jgi:hypothetical protein
MSNEAGRWQSLEQLQQMELISPLYKLLRWSKNIFISKTQFAPAVSPFSSPTHGSHCVMSTSPSPPQIRDFWPPARSNSTTGTHLQPEAATATLPLIHPFFPERTHTIGNNTPAQVTHRLSQTRGHIHVHSFPIPQATTSISKFPFSSLVSSGCAVVGVRVAAHA